jgi:hypothetical protein
MDNTSSYTFLDPKLQCSDEFGTHIKDSGERDTYNSGAVRDNHEGKGRFDLISIQGLLRLARWYELGSKKYSDRNWEKGMLISRYVDAAFRHLVKYVAGCDDEDHLAAVAWNVFAIMHHEEKCPEQQDLPEWKDRITKNIIKLDKE